MSQMTARRPFANDVRCSRLGVFTNVPRTVAISSAQASRSGSKALSHVSERSVTITAAVQALLGDMSWDPSVLPNGWRLSCGATPRRRYEP